MIVDGDDMEHDGLEECETDSDLELEDICPLRDDAKVIFQGHSSGILCVELDDTHNIAYTGGMDDKLIVWELKIGRQITELTGHNDSVTHISANKIGTLIVSGDLSGGVLVWQRVADQEYNKVHEIEAASVVGLSWSYIGDQESFFICDAVGTVQSWLSNVWDRGPAIYKYGKGCSCSKFCLVLSDAWSAVLYSDESCSEHESCDNRRSLQLSHNGSDRKVKVDLMRNSVNRDEESDYETDSEAGLGAAWAHRAMTGDSHVIVIGDWSQLLVVIVTGHGYMAQGKVVTALIKGGGLVDNVALSPALPTVAFSTKTGLLGLYDLTRQCVRQVWNYGATMPLELRGSRDQDEDEPATNTAMVGVSQVCWSTTKPVFYSAGLDGRLCEWDGRIGYNETAAAPVGEVPTWWGYSGIVWDMAVTHDGSTLVVVSEDKAGRLFLV